jgi:hypothetical protein
MDTPYQIARVNGRILITFHVIIKHSWMQRTLAFYLVCLRVSRAQDKHVGKVLGMTGAVEPAVHGNLKDESNGSKGHITFASWSTLAPEIRGTKYHECAKRHALLLLKGMCLPYDRHFYLFVYNNKGKAN